MRVTVRGKGTEVTAPLKSYVEKKIAYFEKRLNEDADVQVRLRVEPCKGSRPQQHIAEVTIHFHSYMIRAEEKTDDMYASIDAMMETIEKQYRKHKEKLDKKHKVSAIKAEAEAALVEGVTEESNLGVVERRKKYSWKPMTEEEAIMQMDMLGHNFFVFTNADTEEINVVYARNNGSYGIIEPE